MSERLRPVEANPINTAELERKIPERLKSTEHSGEHQKNRHEAVESAREHLKQAEQAQPRVEATPTEEPARRGVLTRATNYRHTMISLQHRMRPATRAFSRIIHAPGVEVVSEVAGKTVFRPSVTLGAVSCAALFTAILYLYSRSQGLVMRGSIVWIALLVGALVGLIIEFINNKVRLRRS